MNNPGTSITDLNQDAHSAVSTSSLPDGSLPLTSSQPLGVVQRLLDSNQTLLTQIAALEEILTSSSSQEEAGTGVAETAQAALTQTRQLIHHQTQLIEVLFEHIGANLRHVADFERDIALNQRRHREQAHRLVQLEQDYQSLHRRLQRQQYYSLQLKAALEKTIRKSQVDPSWVREAWSQFAQSGSNVLSPNNIAHWSEAHADPLSSSAETEMEQWLNAIKEGKDDSEDGSPWSASQLLVGGDANDFYDDLYNSSGFDTDNSETPTEKISLFPSDSRRSGANLKAVKTSTATESNATTEQLQDQLETNQPSSPEPSRSCSFQLTDHKPVDPNNRKTSMPELPSFLNPQR